MPTGLVPSVCRSFFSFSGMWRTAPTTTFPRRSHGTGEENSGSSMSPFLHAEESVSVAMRGRIGCAPEADEIGRKHRQLQRSESLPAADPYDVAMSRLLAWT